MVKEYLISQHYKIKCVYAIAFMFLVPSLGASLVSEGSIGILPAVTTTFFGAAKF